MFGDLVAFPTETVYGLGADACNSKAVARIYEVKGRPIDHPLIVHIASLDGLGNWAQEVPEYAIQLAEKQKAKYTYGVLEKQFRNTFKRAAAKKGITGENKESVFHLFSHSVSNTLVDLENKNETYDGYEIIQCVNLQDFIIKNRTTTPEKIATTKNSPTSKKTLGRENRKQKTNKLYL